MTKKKSSTTAALSAAVLALMLLTTACSTNNNNNTNASNSSATSPAPTVSASATPDPEEPAPSQTAEEPTASEEPAPSEDDSFVTGDYVGLVDGHSIEIDTEEGPKVFQVSPEIEDKVGPWEEGTPVKFHYKEQTVDVDGQKVKQYTIEFIERQ
jgi:uncharacterized protein with LGFP repeats